MIWLIWFIGMILTRRMIIRSCRFHEIFDQYHIPQLCSFVLPSSCLFVRCPVFSRCPGFSSCPVVCISVCLIWSVTLFYRQQISISNPQKPEKLWPQLCHWPSALVSLTLSMDSRDASASKNCASNTNPRKHLLTSKFLSISMPMSIRINHFF